MEIISWVLSYGARAEVLESVTLREEVTAIVKKMRDMYRGTASHSPPFLSRG